MQLYIALAVVGSASAFHTPSRLHPTPIHIGDKKGALIASPSTYTNSYRRDVSVGLFRDLLRKVKDRGDNSGNDDGAENKDEGDEQLSSTAAAAAEQEEEEKLATPFFAANFLETRSTDTTTEAAEEVSVIEATIVPDEPEVQPLPPPPPPRPPVVEVVKTPTQVAEQLRAQAARIRLEAEKRTVELTLEKIEKLNTQLELMKTKEDVDAK
eukprot:scaffold1102_cov96-Skeletonema_marinoi.AAC.4